jgi:hypothetical protein
MKKMKVRELPNWPPESGGAFRSGSVFPVAGEAIISGFVPLQDRSVTFKACFGEDVHSAQTEKIAEQLQTLIQKSMGKPVAGLGESDIEVE